MKLRLNGIEAECIIGERPDERVRTQTLRLDVELEIPDKAADTDELADTVDYAATADAIRIALAAAKCRMIEHAAKVACDACTADGRVTAAKVSVTKAGSVPHMESATAVWSPCERRERREADTVAGRLVALLRAQGMTCATAESCTGGGVGAAITAVPGSSEVFAGGVTSYSNEVKRDVLGVPEKSLEDFGAVSPQVATAMAEGARKLLRTDLAVSITGIAGPGGGSAEKPVGLVWFALASADGTRTEKTLFQGDRARVREQAVVHALGMLTVAAV